MCKYFIKLDIRCEKVHAETLRTAQFSSLTKNNDVTGCHGCHTVRNCDRHCATPMVVGDLVVLK